MFSIFSAIASTTLFSGVAILWKRLRDRNVGTFAILGIGILSVPFWAIVALILFHYHIFPVLKSPYVVVLILWVVGAFSENWLGTYLYKYRTLTELKVYETLAAIGLGVIIDIFLFKNQFSFYTISATFLLFASGIILTKNIKPDLIRSGISFIRKILPILILGTFFRVLNIAIFKIALSYQPNPLWHSVFGESILYTLFFLIGFKGIKFGMKNKKIRLVDGLLIGILLFTGTVFQIFMIRDFSVSINVVLSVIPVALYSLYDIQTKKIKLSFQNIAAILLIIIGLFLTKF